MHVEHLSNSTDLQKALKKLNVDGGGVSILRDKGNLHIFRIIDLHVGAANILKQDALSVGADFAVPRGTVTASLPRVDGILIANERQLQTLVQKEKAQPLGLKTLAIQLESFIRQQLPRKIEIMGIINANDDSFYHQSRFSGKDAVAKIEQMVEEGADIIDIGGVSSRPGSMPVSAEEEFYRVKPVIDALYERHTYDAVRLSLDSYAPSVISYALERGFTMVNDITGLGNDEVARLCGSYKAIPVIMHMQGEPGTMQNNPTYDSVIHDVELFFRERIEKARHYGIEQMILDTGIGFGKRLEDNLSLITHQKHFLSLGYPLLVGASRKSMIDVLSPSSSAERLPGTLAIHLKAVEEGASILRVHDVKEHMQALKVWQALRG